MGFSAGFIVFLLFSFSIVATLLYRFLKNRIRITTTLFRPIFMAGIIVIVVGIFALTPINSDAKSSFFSLFGLVITAVLGVSSTTFVSNAMAGFMLRNIKNFQPGDFIEVNQEFGRVSEMGLLHTEIQTKDRSLTTLPNMYLISHPVTVTPANGALVAAHISLGYDISHSKIEELLIKAATITGLNDAFVQVTELGDFSIGYRVAGFLPDAKHILTSRSNLRKQMITTLHQAGVEIVSPTFMNQRQFSTSDVFIADEAPRVDSVLRNKNQAREAEGKVFDKADNAENLNQMQLELTKLNEQITQLNKDKPDEYEKKVAVLTEQVNQLQQQIDTLQTQLKSPETKDKLV